MKEEILKTDVYVQVILFIGMLISLILSWSGGFFFCFFSFALSQVGFAFYTGIQYNDPNKIQYLKVFFWLHIVGSIIACILANTFLAPISLCILVIAWIISPFLMAIWAFNNSYCAWEASKELEELN